MALDQSFVGRTYPPTDPYEVGREKIREFAKAVGDDNPVYMDTEAAKALGHPDVVAPPSFPFVLTFAASRQVVEDPELGIDYSRVVHGEQRFVASRPIRAGDLLTTTVTIDTIRSAGGHDMLTTRSEVATTSGDHVVTAFSTLVVRGPDGDS
jgi:acyl dehydratase